MFTHKLDAFLGKQFTCEYAKYPAFQRGSRLYLAISSKLIKLLHRATVQSLKGHHILIITYVGGHTADYPIPTVVTREVALALFPHTRFHVKVVGWALRKSPLRAASPCESQDLLALLTPTGPISRAVVGLVVSNLDQIPCLSDEGLDCILSSIELVKLSFGTDARSVVGASSCPLPWRT